MNLSAFHSYDVRGIYPTDIDEKLASLVARAFAFYTNSKKIVVGNDDRTSSPALHEAVVQALIAAGVDVYDLGSCPTPLLNYAVAAGNFDVGIMISASHNPKEYNALKLIKDGIQMSSPGDLDDIKKLCENPSEIKNIKESKGYYSKLSILDTYIKELNEQFTDLRGIHIVVDYANGMGSITAEPVFKKLGLNVIRLNEKIDCTFPNHGSNPLEEKNLDQLRAKVLATHALCGIFFDGDADRSFIIDDEGRVLYPDTLTAMIIPHQLAGRSEKRIYYDLRFSKIVTEVATQNRGVAQMLRVGNPFYKQKLKQEGGVFAAELSGHFMFQDHFCIDDGLYAALKILHTMTFSGKKLSELADPLMKYPITPELNFKVKNPDVVLEKVESAFSDGDHIQLDGVYVKYDDAWFSLRKSNTEPLVRLRIEADTQDRLEEIKRKILNIINSE